MTGPLGEAGYIPEEMDGADTIQQGPWYRHTRIYRDISALVVVFRRLSDGCIQWMVWDGQAGQESAWDRLEAEALDWMTRRPRSSHISHPQALTARGVVLDILEEPATVGLAHLDNGRAVLVAQTVKLVYSPHAIHGDCGDDQ